MRCLQPEGWAPPRGYANCVEASGRMIGWLITKPNPARIAEIMLPPLSGGGGSSFLRMKIRHSAEAT